MNLCRVLSKRALQIYVLALGSAGKIEMLACKQSLVDDARFFKIDGYLKSNLGFIFTIIDLM